VDSSIQIHTDSYEVLTNSLFVIHTSSLNIAVVVENMQETPIKVFISHRESKCDECGDELGRQAWITLEENKGALCLSCSDLDELVFLPTGDAALTRRAKKHSTLSAVVLKFSRARGRYERQVCWSRKAPWLRLRPNV
jgi:hypothetical protein